MAFYQAWYPILNSKAIYVNNITDLNNPPKCPKLDTKINQRRVPSALG